MARSASPRPHDVRAMAQNRLAGTLKLLVLGMDTIVTGLQQSQIEFLHKGILKAEVDTSVSENASYFRRSGYTPSRPIDVVILVKQRRLYTFFIGNGVTLAHSSDNHETAFIAWVNKRSVDTFYIRNVAHWFRLLSTQKPDSLLEVLVVATGRKLACIRGVDSFYFL